MPQTNKSSLSWMSMTIIFANMGLAVLAAWACLQFGSLRTAAVYLAGDRLLADARSKTFGMAVRGQDPTVKFELYNRTSKPIAIIGASSSCTCVVAEDLPMTITTSGKGALKVKIRTASKSGRIMESLKVYTDYADQPVIELKVIGRVSEGTQL